ncbi:hypothetical protein ACHAQJ_000641 [Trichoderma viride]
MSIDISSNGSKGINRNSTERDKCLARDKRACVFTKSAHPEACHIVPFAMNSSQKKIMAFKSWSTLSVGLLGVQNANLLDALIARAPGSSDKSWNMLCLHPLLHSFWSRCRFAIKCLGITPSDDQHSIIQLQFHWMPRNNRLPGDLVKPPYKDAIQGMLQNLAIEQEDGPGFSIFKDYSGRELETGQIFEILLEKEDAEKMKIVLDVQWAAVRILAISGAAGVWKLEDDLDEQGGVGDVATAERIEDWIEALSPSTPR